jgi:2-methylcitrate dehydratase PrpD
MSTPGQPETPVTDALVEFVVALDARRLPPAVVEAAGACLLDWLGTAIRGSREPLAAALHAVIAATGAAPQATVVGHGARTSALLAALANGAQAHALDFDDTHIPSLIHGSAPVAPVVLGLGEARHAGGMDALGAFVAGFEVETRIGRVLGHALARRGWHATAVLGHFGAAAAAGKLLGLDAARLRQALGIAGTQAAGLELSFGTMCKPLHPGKAAMNGLLSALLAAEGYTGPVAVLESPAGLGGTFLGTTDMSAAIDELGVRFEVLENSVKPYAACLLTHATIDAGRALREQAPAPDAVEAVVCHVHPLGLKVAANPAPRTGLEGKFSLAFCAALALARGEAGEAEFTDASVADAALGRLASRVRLEGDAGLAENEARMTVRLRDGRVLEQHVKAARGTAQNPLSRAELETKFRRLAGTALPAARVDALVAALRDLPRTPDVASLAALAAPEA